jgi:hypothetical protein
LGQPLHRVINSQFPVKEQIGYILVDQQCTMV